MFLLLRHDKNVIYLKLVNNPFKDYYSFSCNGYKSMAGSGYRIIQFWKAGSGYPDSRYLDYAGIFENKQILTRSWRETKCYLIIRIIFNQEITGIGNSYLRKTHVKRYYWKLPETISSSGRIIGSGTAGCWISSQIVSVTSLLWII